MERLALCELCQAAWGTWQGLSRPSPAWAMAERRWALVLLRAARACGAARP